jgi:acyl carrier protein
MSQHRSSAITVLETIWRELLSVDSVHPTDNFIALGGDSIAATQCVGRIQGALGVPIPVVALLSDEGSFGGLADHVESKLAKAPIAS